MTFRGIHDLFSLCNIVEMANILHPDSYHAPGLRVSQRQEMIRGRASSRAVVQWIISNYEIEGLTTECFYWSYLAYQALAVCHAKKFGEQNKVFCYTGQPIAKQVEALIRSSFQNMEKFWEQWDYFKGIEPLSFAWPQADDGQLHVKIRIPKVPGESDNWGIMHSTDINVSFHRLACRRSQRC
jgi:hypothetical protein